MNSQSSTKMASERQGRGRDSGVGKGSRCALHVLSPLVHFFFLSYFYILSIILKLDYYNVDEWPPPLPKTMTEKRLEMHLKPR